MTDHTDPYPERVLALEAEGMTTSDAQAVADAELMGAKPTRKPRRTPAEKIAADKARSAAKTKRSVAAEAKTNARKAKVAKALPLCKCGCGEHTKGGTFRPGHDARYHAALKAAGKKVALIGTTEQREKANTRNRAARAAAGQEAAGS